MLASPQPRCSPASSRARWADDVARRARPRRCRRASAPGSCPAIIASDAAGGGVGLQAAAAAAPAQRALVVEGEVADLPGRAAGAVEELVVDDDARRRRRRRSSRRPSCRGRAPTPCRCSASAPRLASFSTWTGTPNCFSATRARVDALPAGEDRRGPDDVVGDRRRAGPARSCAAPLPVRRRASRRASSPASPRASAWAWPASRRPPLLGEQRARSGRRGPRRRGCGRSRCRRRARRRGPAAPRTPPPAARARSRPGRTAASSRTMLETVAGARPVARASSAWVNVACRRRPAAHGRARRGARRGPAAGWPCAARTSTRGQARCGDVAWTNCALDVTRCGQDVIE